MLVIAADSTKQRYPALVIPGQAVLAEAVEARGVVPAVEAAAVALHPEDN